MLHSVRRRRRVLAVVVAVVVVVFLVATAVLFIWPPTGSPHKVDGIVSLNGADEPSRENKAISLAEKGYAPVLLFSQGHSQSPRCPTVANVQVVCFAPNPGNTLGEIRFASQYAKAHDWKSMIIVPSTTQAIRAQYLAGQCFSGHVTVVPASGRLRNLPYDIVYGWASLVKALVLDHNC
jgi:uncharacterized SAM-binding protein YcdF (DUF218 family)